MSVSGSFQCMCGILWGVAAKSATTCIFFAVADICETIPASSYGKWGASCGRAGKFPTLLRLIVFVAGFVFEWKCQCLGILMWPKPFPIHCQLEKENNQSSTPMAHCSWSFVFWRFLYVTNDSTAWWHLKRAFISYGVTFSALSRRTDTTTTDWC